MPEERIEVGALARDVSVQVATQVANTVAAAKTNELLSASASAEASRVSAEQGRVTAEQGRVTAEQGRVAAEDARATEFAGFEDEIDSKITRGIGERDGTLKVGKADVADNLVATKGLTVNDDPMSFGIVGGAQKSAVGDGNASLNKLVCVDVVRNQLINKNTFDQSKESGGITWVNNGDGSITFSGTLSGSSSSFDLSKAGLDKTFINGHIYFYQLVPSVLSGFDMRMTRTDGTTDYTLPIEKTSIASFTKATATWRPYLVVTGTSAYSATTVKPLIIDLTQRYGNNEVVNAIIGTGTNEEKLARLLAFDPEILTNTGHNVGTLVPSKTAKLLPFGVNQWDEEWENGTLDENGQAGTGTNVRAKKLIPVFPNTTYYAKTPKTITIAFYDSNEQPIVGAGVYKKDATFTTPKNCSYMRFALTSASDYGTTYNNDICINVSDSNINGKYYPSKRNPVTLPNYEGHGILKVVDGKVVADGTELYPDGNSKKRYGIVDLGTLNWIYNSSYGFACTTFPNVKNRGYATVANIICPIYKAETYTNVSNKTGDMQIAVGNYDLSSDAYIIVNNNSYTDATAFKAAMSGVYLVYELATEEDITTPVYQSTFPVEQGGTLQFLDENDNPIAGLQGSEIFYQKNIKAFVEALGEATNWDPERIKRLGDLSFTPEYVDITLNPSPTGAYARAQVYNASFTIVISAALTGTANGSIAFQDSEIDLSNFQTKPADYLYDMDGKKVSEAPTTADCNIASFVGRSKNGTLLWSLLHSGVNKVKIHIEEAVPLDSYVNGKLDCRTNMIL